MRNLVPIFLLLTAFFCAGTARSQEASEEVRIGIAAIDGKDVALKAWAPIARELEGAVPGRKFSIVPFTYDEFDALIKDGRLSFVLSGPTYYVDYEMRYGISRLATLVRSTQAGPVSGLGGVIVVRADRKDLLKPEDLKGKAIVGTGELALGGWLAQLREFGLLGIDAEDFSKIQRVGSFRDAVLHMLDGKADAAFVRTGTIEALIGGGRVARAELRVLRFPTAPIGFPLEISTRLYPEWAFAKTLRTPDDLAKRVALALLSLSLSPDQKKSAGIDGFTVPVDYAPVRELLRERSMGPYAGLHGNDLADLLGDHGYWVAGVLCLILMLSAALFFQARATSRQEGAQSEMLRLRGEFERNVAERTRNLEAEIERRKQIETERIAESAKVKESLMKTVKAVALTVEMRDPYMSGHQQRVALLASAIGAEMKLVPEMIESIYLAGLVHDIGMIYVPSEITNRPGQLSPLEYEIVKTHPRIGHEIMSSVDLPWPIADIVLNHHRRPDGSGYPQDVEGGIPLESLILGVADVVEAMNSHRPYRPALGMDKAVAEIESGKGTKYDPDVAAACLRLLKEKRFDFRT